MKKSKPSAPFRARVESLVGRFGKEHIFYAAYFSELKREKIWRDNVEKWGLYSEKSIAMNNRWNHSHNVADHIYHNYGANALVHRPVEAKGKENEGIHHRRLTRIYTCSHTNGQHVGRLL